MDRHAEAADLLPEVRTVATGLGDQIFLIRLTWLDGRLAAGLGRTQEALGLLELARAEFHARDMGYDVALALLETAALLLGEARTAEVKALAPCLSDLFKAKGIHREALAALAIFRRRWRRRPRPRTWPAASCASSSAPGTTGASSST